MDDQTNLQVGENWDVILRMAVMGAERGSGLTKVQGVHDFLSELTKVNQLKKAKGAILLNGLPLPPVEVQKVNRTISAHSIHHFNLILDGTFPDALNEFMHLLHEKNKVLPAETLPSILNECLLDPDLWEKVRPGLGDGAPWLMKLNPAWSALEPDYDISYWATGSAEERIWVFKDLRSREPHHALELLKRNWGFEPSFFKIEFLNLLGINLSSNDESFLVELISDSDRRIQFHAADLLSKIKGSEYAVQLIQFIRDHIKWDEEGCMNLALPEKIPQPLSYLLFDTGKKANNKGLGKKATQFYRLLRKLSLEDWETVFDTTPKGLFKQIKYSDWSDLLLRSIEESLLTAPNEKWMLELANFWMRDPQKNLWDNPVGRGIIAKWPSDLFNSLLLRYFNFNPGLPQKRHLVTYALTLNHFNWSDKLATRVIRIIQDWIAQPDSLSWNSELFKSILNNAAYRISPKLFKQVQQGWPTGARFWGVWEKDVQTFLQTLLFRKEMNTALNE